MRAMDVVRDLVQHGSQDEVVWVERGIVSRLPDSHFDLLGCPSSATNVQPLQHRNMCLLGAQHLQMAHAVAEPMLQLVIILWNVSGDRALLCA